MLRWEWGISFRYFVSSLMGADLSNILKIQRLTDDHVQFLVYQILRGLKYIHSAGVIHRVSPVLTSIMFPLPTDTGSRT